VTGREWLILLGIFFAIFLAAEAYSIWHDKRIGATESTTLSAYTWRLFKKWTLTAIVFGAVVGGLSVHFAGWCP
jgi:hypothetical protein